MEQPSFLSAKFDCPVARQNCSLLATAHDCKIWLVRRVLLLRHIIKVFLLFPSLCFSFFFFHFPPFLPLLFTCTTKSNLPQSIEGEEREEGLAFRNHSRVCCTYRYFHITNVVFYFSWSSFCRRAHLVFNHVILFPDLIDLWVIYIKKPMILCGHSTSWSREQSTKRREHAVRTCERFVYLIVNRTRFYDY